MVNQLPVPVESTVGDDFHNVPVPFALVVRRARIPVQGRALEHCREGQLQVFPGQLRQRVLVRDDLALFGELDLAFQHAVGLGHDGVIGGSAAAAH